MHINIKTELFALPSQSSSPGQIIPVISRVLMFQGSEYCDIFPCQTPGQIRNVIYYSTSLLRREEMSVVLCISVLWSNIIRLSPLAEY